MLTILWKAIGYISFCFWWTLATVLFFKPFSWEKWEEFWKYFWEGFWDSSSDPFGPY